MQTQTHTHAHRHLYLLTGVHTFIVFSKRAPTRVLIIFSKLGCQARDELPSKAFQHVNALSTHTNMHTHTPLFSPRSYYCQGLLKANSRYLHPLVLRSHSAVVLWYRRAGEGTRLSLSGSLGERRFHLDRYLFSNVPRERPTCPPWWLMNRGRREARGWLNHKSWMLIYCRGCCYVMISMMAMLLE